MLQTAIAAAAVFAAISAWVVSIQRRLVALDENAASALYQLGVQMSCRFDALTALLSIASAFAGPECQALAENVRTRRGVITGRSTPEDVLRQEEVLAEALECLARIAERYPELKASRTYQKTMGAVETFGGMVRTSRLIYNDSVSKLNREVRKFPASAVAKASGSSSGTTWVKAQGALLKARLRRGAAREEKRGAAPGVTKEETYMGLFSRKPPCPVCGGKVRSTAVKIEGKPICKNCLGKIDVESGRESRLTIRELREYLDFYERNRMLGEKFTVSERFDLGFLDAKIIFDFDNRLFCMGKNPDKTVFEGKHVKFSSSGKTTRRFSRARRRASGATPAPCRSAPRPWLSAPRRFRRAVRRQTPRARRTAAFRHRFRGLTSSCISSTRTGPSSPAAWTARGLTAGTLTSTATSSPTGRALWRSSGSCAPSRKWRSRTRWNSLRAFTTAPRRSAAPHPWQTPPGDATG